MRQISFSTHSYADFAENMYVGLRRVGITNYCLVVLDDGMYKKARAMDICVLRDPMADYMVSYKWLTVWLSLYAFHS